MSDQGVSQSVYGDECVFLTTLVFALWLMFVKAPVLETAGSAYVCPFASVISSIRAKTLSIKSNV